MHLTLFEYVFGYSHAENTTCMKGCKIIYFKRHLLASGQNWRSQPPSLRRGWLGVPSHQTAGNWFCTRTNRSTPPPWTPAGSALSFSVIFSGQHVVLGSQGWTIAKNQRTIVILLLHRCANGSILQAQSHGQDPGTSIRQGKWPVSQHWSLQPNGSSRLHKI